MDLFFQPFEIRATLAAWQFFRTLGFPSENIFVGLINGKILIAIKKLQKDFSISVSSSDMEKEMFEKLWIYVAESINTIPEWQLKKNYQELITIEKIHTVVTALRNADIEIPNSLKN